MLRRVAPALAALALLSCGVDGTSRYAALATWTDGSAIARVRYQTPPWNVRGGDRESIALEVDTTAGPDAGVPPKFAFYVTVGAGTAASALAADAAVASGRGEVPLPYGDAGTLSPTITTDSGDVGMRWAGVVGGTYGRYYEHVAFDVGTSGQVVHIQIESNTDPRTPELDAMIASVDVAPFSPP